MRTRLTLNLTNRKWFQLLGMKRRVIVMSDD
jgi:hypothetical protein